MSHFTLSALSADMVRFAFGREEAVIVTRRYVECFTEGLVA